MMEKTIQSAKFEQPYRPSWYDHFTNWVEQPPGPVVAYYFVGAVVSVGIYLVVQVSQGAYAESGFFAWHIFLALQPLILLAWMHYLDHAAVIALRRFKPAIKVGGDILGVAQFKITTLPARPTLFVTLIGMLLFLMIFGRSSSDQLVELRLGISSISMFTVNVYFYVMWGILGVAVYHTIHQITVIRELFADYSVADPYNPEPLYAFSGITGQTAVFLLAISYGWILLLVTSGQMQNDPISGLSVNIFFAFFSLFIFTWPLWGAHQLLVDAKKAALTKNAALMNTAIKELHNGIQEKNLDVVGDWQTALGALEIERTRIEKLPTWPWRPEALRGLVAAVVVPILVWVMQYVLERVLR
jgi:hypothetical protein